jgi:Fe-S oxidoreductase
MLDFLEEKRRFGEACTACGLCVTVCPIVPLTELQGEDPVSIMASVLDLYGGGEPADDARQRILSCMGCHACRRHCPEGLDPALGLFLAREILREKGEALPRALSFLLPETPFNLMKAVEAVQVRPEDRPWITDVRHPPPTPSNTVLFTGCTGIMQPDLVRTALDLIRRFDPSVQALGGVDYCCGDTNLRAGDPAAARDHFCRLVKGLDAFRPESAVFLCPTCKMFFDIHQPETAWSRHFVMDFLRDHLDRLGPMKAVETTVTIHDACHLVRGESPSTESPRALLSAVPGVRIVEMAACGEEALCCGATAMATVGAAGLRLRAERLRQAEAAGAEIMALYCPACQSIFAPETARLPFGVVHVLTLLGRSLGIEYEDLLLRYFTYRDPERVLAEAEGCLAASPLPQGPLRRFVGRYFRA